MEQIAFADRIIINKIDLVTKEEVMQLKQRIKSINAVASIYEAEFGKIDLDLILDVKGFELSRILEMDSKFLEDTEHQHDQSITSVGIKHTGLINGEKFQGWIRKLLMEKGQDLFRSKGILYFKEASDKYVFHAVHMLMSGNMEEPVAAGEVPQNRLIFIGRNLDRQQLENGFKKCCI